MSITVSCLPGIVNSSVVKGATFRRRLTWKEAATETPINLTGYTAKSQIRDQPGGLLLHEMTTENGGITLGGSAGTIDLLIPAGDTTDFAAGCYDYDLELTSGSGEVTYLIKGEFCVQAPVTV